MSTPFVAYTTEIEVDAFQSPANGIWRTEFCEVGEGFSIRAVALAPQGNKAEVTYEWSPYEPTPTDPCQPDPERLARVYHALDIYLVVYYAAVYGFVPVRLEVY